MPPSPPALVDLLEPRQLLSGAPVGMSPATIRHAYRIDQISFQRGSRTFAGDGTGQTIAIIDAFNDPTIKQDLRTFDQAFGLSDTDGRGRFALTVATPQGRPDTDGGWAMEASLDVEWAHAVAPGAHILLVEAASANTVDLLNAINFARHRPGVVAVSMSWGGDESPFETSFDQLLRTPGRHPGISFVTSSGDTGAPSTWPASSPNVIAVGGTTLHVDSMGNYLNETGWGGSGGGPSPYEGTYSPDVAFDADPQTGFAVFDSTSTPTGDSGWMQVGGTSAGAPQWAGLFAIAAQGRALRHRASLDGATQTLAALYALPADDFHDIVIGDNGFPAGPGYDLVTGRGTPVADQLVADLVSWSRPR
jgi:subtilase family serine protease